MITSLIYTLTAQWEETVDITVTVVVDNTSKNGETTAPTDTVTSRQARIVLTHQNDNDGYSEINGTSKNVTVTIPQGNATTTTVFYEKAPLYPNVESGDTYSANIFMHDYYVIDRVTEEVKDGDKVVGYNITLTVEYIPGGFDLVYNVVVDGDVQNDYIPKAVDLKIAYWNNNAWDYIDEHKDSDTPESSVDVTIEKSNRSGQGDYEVWSFEEANKPYYYRVVPIGIDFDGETTLPATEKTAGASYKAGPYIITVDVTDGDEPTGSSLAGAYAEDVGTNGDVSLQQKGTITVYVEMVEPYDVTFNANGGTIKGTATHTVEDVYQIPDLSQCVPTHSDSNYVFDGWYENADCTEPATSGKWLSGDITLYAKWKAPLTITGTVTIEGTYQQGGQTVKVNERDRATEALVILEEIGKWGEVASQKVTFSYENDVAAGSYKFVVPDDGRKYEILTRVQNYTTGYDNEPIEEQGKYVVIVDTTDDESTVNDALFAGDSTAIVNVHLYFEPDSYDQKVIVDAGAIGEGYRPTGAQAVIYYRDIDDDHQPEIISQHTSNGGLTIDLSNNAVGEGTESVWKYHFDSSRYEYLLGISKLTGNVAGVFSESGTAYDEDTAPYYIEFSPSVAWGIVANAPIGGCNDTGVLKAALIPNTYTVTFDLNAGTDTVSGMDSYKGTDPDDSTKVTYKTSHTWSKETSITAVPERAGYTFTGWICTATAIDASSTEVGAYDTTSKKVHAAVAQDITLTAQWSARTDLKYTVEYYYDDVKDADKTATLNATLGAVITTYTDKTVSGYALDKVENQPLTIGADEDENVIKVYYATDQLDDQDDKRTGGDGIPDKYQATVIYQIQNGTWNGTDDAEDRIEVFTLKTKDAETGEWGSADPAPTLKGTIPDLTDAKPDTGYLNFGAWSPVPSDNTVLTGDATFIYSFLAAHTPLIPFCFDANGGKWDAAVSGYTMNEDNTLATISVTEGSKVDAISVTPTAPVCNEEGYRYEFDGWYLRIDEETLATGKWSFDNVIYYDENEPDGITVAAKWKQVEIPATPEPDEAVLIINCQNENGISLEYKEITLDAGEAYEISGDADATYQIPESIEEYDSNYIYEGVASGDLTGTMDEPYVVVCLLYTKDDLNDEDDELIGGDDIPDKYQAAVTFVVKNGRWSDNTTENQVEVVTLMEKDAEGTWNAVDPAPTVTVPSGMIPDSGYKAGSWSPSVTSGATLTVTESATYTYSFVEDSSDGGSKPAEEPNYHNLRYWDGSDRLKQRSYLEGTIVDLDFVPQKTGYRFVGWEDERGNMVDRVTMYYTRNVYAVWELDLGDPDNTGVSDLLETDDHIQYLFGYPDGSFGPQRNMTRAEAAQMFYNLLRDKTVHKTVTFTDVVGNEWFADAVHTMAHMGVISGYPGNVFMPNKPITRAEFTTMAMKFTHLDQTGSNSFADVSLGDWFYTFVVGASKYGWISGYPDGTFKPNANITRAEVTSIVNNMLGRFADEDYIDDEDNDIHVFTDLVETYWAYYPIMEATNGHDYSKGNQSEDWHNNWYR